MPTNDNDLILMRMRGAPASPGTPETDADPCNPNVMPVTSAGIPAAPGYTELSGPELLEVCGDDAAVWAVAFNQHAVKLGYSAMDEDWLVGWFANAIEHSSAVRAWRSKPATSPVIDNFPG